MMIFILSFSMPMKKLRKTITKVKDVECHESTDGFPVFIPHQSDCTKYYECNGDWPVEMDCPPPLKFDSSLNVCNWPHLVECMDG
jgi:hypothetical protein